MATNRQEVISYQLSLLLLVLPRRHHLFRVASAVLVHDLRVAAGSSVGALTVQFFINLVVNMLYVKLQIFLILNIDIIKELRSTCSASNLSALEALNVLWIHRGLDLIVMNCVSSLHISRVHSTTCLWSTSYV